MSMLMMTPTVRGCQQSKTDPLETPQSKPKKEKGHPTENGVPLSLCFVSFGPMVHFRPLQARLLG
ncbi:MAG: hypothetical protein YYHSYBAR_002362 [Candidatus Fervidibacter sacchari]